MIASLKLNYVVSLPILKWKKTNKLHRRFKNLLDKCVRWKSCQFWSLFMLTFLIKRKPKTGEYYGMKCIRSLWVTKLLYMSFIVAIA
jgi:hypothetical protein